MVASRVVALPSEVERAVTRYVAAVDGALPDVVSGFYVVGSTALGAYRPGRSDIDFIAIVERDLDAQDLRLLRRVQLRSAAAAVGRNAVRRLSPVAGWCNGVFIRRADVTMPASAVAPLVHLVGYEFLVDPGRGMPPVDWKVFAEAGIAVRGDPPSTLGLQPQTDSLRDWNLRNLDQYWMMWATTVRRQFLIRPRWSTAWGMLGAPRLHHTIATGDVITKEEAGEYALDVFESEWHPMLRDAIAYMRREPSPVRASPTRRRDVTTRFVKHVVALAHGARS